MKEQYHLSAVFEVEQIPGALSLMDPNSMPKDRIVKNGIIQAISSQPINGNIGVYTKLLRLRNSST
jgi:hypothetical protein